MTQTGDFIGLVGLSALAFAVGVLIASPNFIGAPTKPLAHRVVGWLVMIVAASFGIPALVILWSKAILG